MAHVLLLSPARASGKRMSMLLRPGAPFALAQAVQSGGAALGEVFAFASGLYFRGKLAYARAFAATALVIVPGRGLVSVDARVDARELRAFGEVPVDARDDRFRVPLERDARLLSGNAVLLGSIATGKYSDILLAALGERLFFPPAFVGRGDMSRGGLLLRCAREGNELEYAPLAGAVRHGPRPPRLGKASSSR